MRVLRFAAWTILVPMVGCASLDPEGAMPSAKLSVYDAYTLNQTREDPTPEKKEIGAGTQRVAHEQPEDSSTKAKETPNSPKPGSERAISLDRAINTTLIADPRIRAGFEFINQANAELLTSSLPPNPSLYLDTQLLPLTRPFTVDRTGGPPQSDATLSYPIDWFLFGKRAANMAAARLGIKMTEADFADLVRQRVTETSVAFYDVLEARALLDLAKQDLAYFEKIEAITRKAVDAGGRPLVDLNRVRLDLLNSRRSLRDAELALVTAQAHLRSLLGRQDGDARFEVEGDLKAKLSAEPITADEAYEVAVENRPDIHSDKYKISQAIASVRAEDRKAYPDITPGLGYTRQYQQKAIGAPDANSYMVAVTATLPYLNRNQGNRLKALSVLTQSRYELQADLVLLRAEIERVASEFRTAYQNATSVAEEQLKLAGEVRDSINQAYEVGGRPLVDVLDAERNYRETYRIYITGRSNYWRALYKLNSAMGKQVVKTQ